MEFKFIMFLILSVVVAIFTIQNSAAVTISFFMFNQEISQALIILISLIIGAIMAAFLGIIRRFSANKSIKEKDKLIKQLEKERDELKVSVEEYRNLITEKEGLDNMEEEADENNILLEESRIIPSESGKKE